MSTVAQTSYAVEAFNTATLSDNKIGDNGALAIQAAKKNLPALRFLELKEAGVKTAPELAARVAT